MTRGWSLRSRMLALVVLGVAPAIVAGIWVGSAELALLVELAILGVVLAASLGAAWFGYERSMVRPVREFMRAAQRVARGDFKARSPPAGSVREFAQIAASFDRMAIALEERDTELQRLLEVSADWYWEQDAGLRFVRFSRNMQSQAGYLPDTYLGRQRWETPHHGVTPEQWTAHRALLEARKPFRDFVVGRYGAGGEEQFVSISGVPKFDREGRFAGYVGASRDVTQLVRASAALQESELRYRSLVDLLPDAVFIHADGVVRFMNRSGARLYGAAEPEELVGARIPDLVAPAARALVEDRIGRLQSESDALPAAEIPQMRRDGTVFYGEVHSKPLELDGGRASVTMVRDVTERRRMEDALRESLQQYRALFDRSPSPMCVVSIDSGGILAANEAAAGLFARPLEELLAMPFARLGAPPPAEWGDGAATGMAAFRDHGIHRLRKKDGTVFDGHLASFPVTFQGRPARLAQVHDLSERQRYEARIEHLASHDGLTGLPNRALLEDRAHQALVAARRAREGIAVLLLGLDRLKDVNDSFGHAAGDQVIREAAGRIRQPLREGDTVARFGGDKFAVLLPGLHRPDDAAPVIRKIQKALGDPFIIENREVFLTASIGVSLSPADGDDMGALLRSADAARRIAKERGGNSVQYSAAELSTRSLERIELEGALRKGLERGEFEVHYQPQVDLYTRRIVGAEALIRWRRPEHGLVAPGRFIQVAEDTGLIVPLGGWTLRAACAQIGRWAASGLPQLRVSVNVSARQFRDSALAEQIREALEAHAVEPRLLEIELTEGLVMDDAEAFIGTLERLKALGIGVAIDDFGTGYSSLSYLKRFPIDKLKIDQSFVRNLPGSEHDAAIARTVIALARSLGLRVVAEGVETFEQLEFLRVHACDEVQGYYFAKPLPPQAFTDLLVRGLEPAIWQPSGAR